MLFFENLYEPKVDVILTISFKMTAETCFASYFADELYRLCMGYVFHCHEMRFHCFFTVNSPVFPSPSPFLLLPRRVWYVAVFWNDFTFSGKPLIFLTKWGIFYGLVGQLEACDVVNNGYHLGFYQEIEIRLKPCEGEFFVLYMKNNTILATRLTFIVIRSWKNMYFHPTLASPPATYDVISRYHSNWAPNLSKNLRKEWTNSYWKRQVLMSYPLGKNSENLMGGGIHPPFVRPRVKKVNRNVYKTTSKIKSFFMAIGWSYLNKLSYTFLKLIETTMRWNSMSKAFRFQ